MNGHSQSTEVTDREIVITRVFDAPRHLVWEAFTKAEHIAAWYGPRGFSTRVERHEFHVGGQWRYVMIGPDGTEYPSEGMFREIVPDERLVITDEFGEGFEHPAGYDLPEGITQALSFEDLDSQTRLTVRIAHPSAEDRRKNEAMGVKEGYASMLDCLGEYLKQMADS